MEVVELSDYQGQSAWRIVTPAATYLFHRRGAGFASILDPDGVDWIGHRPRGGSDGRYRGIPNVIHPEGGFHPGVEFCASRLRRVEPGRVVIDARSDDDCWACSWEILPDRATLTIERIGHPYWILYEGTPGGRYDENEAYMVDSAGHCESCSARWQRRLPDPRWIYFAAPTSRYVLWLFDHGPRADDVVDSYWSMQSNMTVFGFGRLLDSRDPRWAHLTETPARMTLGLLPAADHESIASRIAAAVGGA